MKVLRIYDHLGELKKEFDVYVDGKDFRWVSSYPEPVWLGTISLEELGKESEIQPTPEVEVAKPEPEELTEEEELGQAPFLRQIEGDIGAVDKEEATIKPPFTTALINTEESKEEEVKHEPKKGTRQARRRKGNISAGSVEESQNLSEKD